MASVRNAAVQDARLSMLAARCGVAPRSGIAGVSSGVGDPSSGLPARATDL